MEIHEPQFQERNLDYYIIQADPGINLPMQRPDADADYRLRGRYFDAAAREAYENLAHKLVIFYSYIYRETDYQFVYKVDDGCLLDLDKVPRNPGYDYCGTVMTPTSNLCHLGKCEEQRFNSTPHDFRHNFDELQLAADTLRSITQVNYCGGGYGYGLSRKALGLISAYKEHILSIPLSYEDVLFGQILYLSGIEPVESRFGGYHQVTA